VEIGLWISEKDAMIFLLIHIFYLFYYYDSKNSHPKVSLVVGKFKQMYSQLRLGMTSPFGLFRVANNNKKAGT